MTSTMALQSYLRHDVESCCSALISAFLLTPELEDDLNHGPTILFTT